MGLVKLQSSKFKCPLTTRHLVVLRGTCFTRCVLSRDPAVTAGFAVNTLAVIELYICPSVDYEILFSLEQTHL